MSVLPLRYFSPSEELYGASSGRDLLHASGRGIRPIVGGRRRSGKKTHRRHRRHRRHFTLRKKKGGFVPSVMEGFCSAASKYITPIALFALHKMIRKRTYKKGKK